MNENITALLPPIIVLILFVIIVRALVTVDRRERAARAKIDAQIAAARSKDTRDESKF